MNICLLGSNGFIGKHTLNFLQTQNIDVAGFSSSDRSWIDPVTGMVLSSFTIPSGTDAVIYLAQSPHYLDVPKMITHVLNVNTLSAVRIAELARQAGVKRLIYASTGTVYAPAFTPISENASLRRDNWYILSKIHAEEFLNLYRKYLDISIVRPFGVYGPGQKNRLVPKLLHALVTNREIYIERNSHDPEDLDGLKISLCYIDDAVRILSQLLTSGGPASINLAGDKPVSIRQMVACMEKHLGKKAIVKVIDRYRETDLIADISLLNKTCGLTFTDPQEGIKRTVDAYLSSSSISPQSKTYRYPGC